MSAPKPVEDWAPAFLYFEGDRSKPKFKPEQILKPEFAISFDHCKLCDCGVPVGSAKKHMAAHARELKSWMERRRKEAASASKGGLAQWRKEQELAAKTEAEKIIDAETLTEGGDDDE